MPASTLAPPAPKAALRTTLHERVENALVTSPYTSGRRVRIEAEEGAVRLHGRVESYFEKQMAQEIVRRLDGVQRIENLIEVVWLRGAIAASNG
ncbi:BON domain protein [Pirellulimonas nuda]|uniref:BON domain protein n=1 Tax=Pirellulimonas nuda TaxID=2528009 RepID=A0A518D8L9_9BACT|nr:BON domain-containing protein [Pirellulimonas nuda]QDU87813.1 BON domain protein [Pirellulimonas nuda]